MVQQVHSMSEETMNIEQTKRVTAVFNELYEEIKQTSSDLFTGITEVTVNFSAHCKVKNHFLEFYQAQ